MKVPVYLNAYLQTAPAAPCFHYDVGDTAVCSAKGSARNSFPVKCNVSSVAIQTDDETYRFPPDRSRGVCDWCVFTEDGHRAFFIELKGSDYDHALKQLASTIDHMRSTYGIIPKRAFAVLSGMHPSNSRPGKARALTKFKNRFPGVELCERSRGQAKPEDVLQ